MKGALEQSPAGGLGRIVLVAVLFGLVAPAPLFALPLGILLLVSRPRNRTEIILAATAVVVSVAWLLLPGDLPDQVLRAALVFATSTFVVLAVGTRLTFTHRALAAVGVATLAIVVLFAALGWSWDNLHWWVVSQRSYETSLALAPMRASAGSSAAADQLQAFVDRSVQFEADNYAAMTALKMIAGFALATALYHRVATHPRGTPLGRFRDFRFSEHLGWAAAIPLLIVILPGLLRAKIAATNLLLLTGTLYAFRGLAVAAFLAGMSGMGPLGVAFAVMTAFLMLPVVIGAGILLGVLDTGMDLRSRWAKPPVGN